MQSINDVFKPHWMIPKETMSDLIKVQMFFQYFDGILEGPEFSIEELYSTLFYQG